MMTPAEPRLVLKATPPRHSRQLLERTRLGAGALQLWDKPVVRIEAPAGFGKTSLLAQWRREWLAAGAYVAWLNLDEDDDTASRLIQALAFAMEQATGAKAFARIRERNPCSADDMDRMTEWLAEVANLGAECVLVLDEGERMPAATARQTLPYLFSNLPANLHVIMAMRGGPRLRHGDASGRNPVLRLSAATLRFSPAETIATLQARFGDAVDAQTAQRIHELTEGWPLGLQLFVSSLEQGASVREAVNQLAGQSGDLRHQFVASLLKHLPPDRTDFLVRISILDRIHADLCLALTGRADAAALLDELQDTTPILVSDLEGEWLRLHGLVRDYLRERFAALPAGARKAAHAAAAAWLDESGFPEQGARHALEAGRRYWAWEMAERSLLGMLERGQISHVQEWLEHAPVPSAEQQPRLLATAAWCCALNGRPQEATELAQRALQDPRADASDRLRASVVLSSAAIFTDDIDLAAELAAKWRSEVEAHPERDRFNAFNQLAYLALHSGDVAEARRILSTPQVATPRPFVMDVYRAGAWGLLHLWEGRVQLAIEAMRPMLEQTDAQGGRRNNLSVTLSSPLAMALFENGSIDEAEAVLAGRLDLIETLAAPSSLVHGYVAASRIAAVRGEHARAHEIMETLFAIGERRRMPRAQFVALKELIRQHSLLGHAQVCAHHLERFRAIAAASAQAAAGRWRETLQICLWLATAWSKRAAQDWPGVLDAVDAAAPAAQRMQRGRELVEIDLLRAEAQEGFGLDPGPARQMAMGLAATLGLKSVIADQNDHTRRQPVTEDSVPVRAARIVPTPMLTPAEQRILVLLADRLSNKEIADRLDIGATTIKWHLKNAYSKLNAASREHAVQRARMLGILASP